MTSFLRKTFIYTIHEENSCNVKYVLIFMTAQLSFMTGVDLGNMNNMK